jgi:hypothetical protein
MANALYSTARHCIYKEACCSLRHGSWCWTCCASVYRCMWYQAFSCITRIGTCVLEMHRSRHVAVLLIRAMCVTLCRLEEFCTEAFILKLYRRGNKVCLWPCLHRCYHHRVTDRTNVEWLYQSVHGRCASNYTRIRPSRATDAAVVRQEAVSMATVSSSRHRRPASSPT